ncbi:MAG: hypothetical protein O3B01_17440 [Planctomycetota bacterium]|nr:hypothetical protein [Planctomycetota bacterium]
MESLEGQVFANCRLGEQIGGGGLTSTYRAVDESTEQNVFVILSGGPELPEEHPGRVRFRQIATIAANLSHPNLPAVPGHGLEGDYDFFIKEEITGRPYSHIISEEGPLSVKDAVQVIEAVANALKDIIKAKVADTVVNADSICLYPDDRIMLAGIYNRESTPPKRWEARFRDHHSVLPSERDHVLSLGALLYHLVSGKERKKHKWVVDPVRSIESDPAIRDLPEDFKHLLSILLRTDQNGYSKIDEVLVALQAISHSAYPAPILQDKLPPEPAPPEPPEARPERLTPPGSKAASRSETAPIPEPSPSPAKAPQPQEAGMTWALVAMILFMAALASVIYVFQHLRTNSDLGGEADPASLEYSMLVKKQESLLGDQRFSEALKLVDSFTRKYPDSQWIKYANNEQELIQKSARNRFKEIQEEVERLKILDKNGDAIELLDHVILHFGLQEIIEEAEAMKANLVKRD